MVSCLIFSTPYSFTSVSVEVMDIYRAAITIHLHLLMMLVITEIDPLSPERDHGTRFTKPSKYLAYLGRLHESGISIAFLLTTLPITKDTMFQFENKLSQQIQRKK